MKPTRKALVIGVAGIMGAGKTAVARVFETMGAVRIDADSEGKAMLKEPGIRDSLVAAFGEGIRGAGGEIETARLARAAFSSPESARKLDALTGPPLVSRLRAAVERAAASAEVVVVDAALLPEWKAGSWIDALVVVDSEDGRAAERLSAAGRFAEADFRARMAHQMSRAAKAEAADLVIPNHGTLEELEALAREAYRQLTGGAGHRRRTGKE
jgi:dephospho-CoA kinase